MKNLTPEMIEKAKAAKSTEELYEIAKANGVELTADEAATYFAQLSTKSGELSDDDLDAVAGGGCNDIIGTDGDVRITDSHSCPKCGSKMGTIVVKKWYDSYFINCKECGTELGNHLNIEYERL